MSATTPTPTAEQKQRAEWDLLLLDIEHRMAQMRRLRQETRYAPFLATLSGLTAGAAIFAAATAFVKVFGL